jgi:hypothetical protein
MGTRPEGRWQGLLTAVAAAVALVGLEPAPASGSTIERVPAIDFEWPEAVQPGPARFVVRPATLDELAAVRDRLAQGDLMLATGLGVSALGVAEAAALGGMFAGGLVVGAIVIVPLSLGIYAHDKIVADHVREGLDVEAFLAEIRTGLPADPPAGTTNLEVEVKVLDFGLVPRDPHATGPTDPICLVADAEIVVRQSGEPLYDRFLHVQPYLRSAGARAPFCRRYDRWGTHEAAMLIAARRELARSLADMIRSRLQPIVGSH